MFALLELHPAPKQISVGNIGRAALAPRPIEIPPSPGSNDLAGPRNGYISVNQTKVFCHETK